MTYFSDEEYRALTSSQRTVLDCFKYATAPLTMADIHKELRKKITIKTISRALAKLCNMGIVKRLPAEKKGRGYSNLYRLASTKDKEEVRQEVVREEVSQKDDPLAELDDMLDRLKKQTQ